jgi:FkbM family methyltransferase
MIPFYIRKKIYKSIFLIYKYLIKPKKKVKSIYGIYLIPNFTDRTFKYYFKGTYGIFLSNLIKSIDIKTQFIDIGANQGLYSILAGQNKNIDQVISFEPSLKSSKLLRCNLKLNHVKNCKVIQKGISHESGQNKLHVSEGHSGKNSLRNLSGIESSITETVETVNFKGLNELVPKHSRILIKIDVEGYEEVVISELIKCSFFKNIYQIFCEVDTNWTNVNRLKNILKDRGFTSFEKIGKNPSHYDLLISR